jgi:YHS domain-containing protein
MEKECEACGKTFIATHKLTKYCDECGKHSNGLRKKKLYDNASKRNHRYDYHEPRIYDLKCEECEKNIGGSLLVISKYRYNVNDETHYFCTKNCKEKYLNKHRYCYQCHKKLINPIIFGWHNDMCFCSDECKFEFAAEKKILRTCEHCGKKFVRKKFGWFCSQDCARAARKNGWVKPEPKFEDDWF